MATHSSVLAWRIPGTEEPGGLPSMGSHRVGHDWSDLAAAAVILVGFPGGSDNKECPWVRKIPWRKAWQPTSVFLPGEFHAPRSLVGYSPRGHRVNISLIRMQSLWKLGKHFAYCVLFLFLWIGFSSTCLYSCTLNKCLAHKWVCGIPSYLNMQKQ